MDNKTTQSFILTSDAVGAFFMYVICGSIFTSLFGLCNQPISNFFAAFRVAIITYLSSPYWNKQFTIIFFVFGAICAWLLIADSWYLGSYQDKAYQPMHLPFAITLIGGLLLLAHTLNQFRSYRNET